MVIWVRSLVPKEKNSATSAILSARGAEFAGDFDHGAEEVFDLAAGLFDEAVGEGAGLLDLDIEFFVVDGEGDHDFGETLPPFLATAMAASMMAVTCMSRISG